MDGGFKLVTFWRDAERDEVLRSSLNTLALEMETILHGDSKRARDFDHLRLGLSCRCLVLDPLCRRDLLLPLPGWTVPRHITRRTGSVFSNCFFVSWGRHARRYRMHRRRHGLPVQQFGIGSHASSPTPVCWRWVWYVVHRLVPCDCWLGE